MENMDKELTRAGKALAWARAHKRAVLSGTVLALSLVAHFAPGVPRTDIVNAVSLFLGA